MIDEKTIFSMAQANQDFSQIAHAADQTGKSIIVENDQPKYLVLSAESYSCVLELTEDEIIDIVAKRVLYRYLPAFKALANQE
ncbi:MAG: hypothetical protein IJU56_10695 [Clostridia bacterium]|nr:hypothetical protein [Clostridia bacterium]